MMVEQDLQELLAKLNQAGADKFRYSAKITTNAKGEAQIHCSVKSNESVDDCKILLENLVKQTIGVASAHGLRLPSGGGK